MENDKHPETIHEALAPLLETHHSMSRVAGETMPTHRHADAFGKYNPDQAETWEDRVDRWAPKIAGVLAGILAGLFLWNAFFGTPAPEPAPCEIAVHANGQWEITGWDLSAGNPPEHCKYIEVP